MATFYNTESIITNGLTFYIDMFNTKSYSGSGTKINDLSGSIGIAGGAKTATIFSGLPFDSNQNGGAFRFEADSGEYIRVDLLDSLMPTNDLTTKNPFTFSMWIQRIGGGTIVSRASGNGSLQMRFAGAGAISLVDSMVKNIGTFSNSTLQTDKTYNITLTRASGTQVYKLYINGTTTNPDTGNTIGTLTYPGLGYTSKVTDTIGRNPNGEPLNAYVYAVSSYSRVLSDAEILHNFNVFKNNNRLFG